MKRCLTHILMVLFLTSAPIILTVSGSLAGSLIWAPEPLAGLIKEGLAQNRELQSLELKVAALEEEIDFAGSLDDPRIGFGVLNLPTDSFSFSQEPMTQKQLFIAQKFPWFGKRDLKSKRAATKAIRAVAVLSAKRLDLARQIADTYYELGFVQRRQEINKRLIQMVKQLLRVSETKYAAGQGLQGDVLQAQVEMSKLMDEAIMLKKMYRSLEDQLNGLLNRDGFEPISLPDSILHPDFTLDLEALKSVALNNNPQLYIKRMDIDLATIEHDLAGKAYWPDMDVKLAYGQRDEDAIGRELSDFISASMTMNIPLWQNKRQDKQLSASENRNQAAIKSYQNLLKRLPHQVDAQVNEIQATIESYNFYKQAILFQARQWAQSSMAAYKVGKVEFNTMMNAQIQVLRFELNAEKYLYEIYQKRAKLEELLGGPIMVTEEKGTSS